MFHTICRMNVRRVGDASAFLEAAEPLLLADEARHNLLLGIAGTLRDQPAVYEGHGLWLVAEGDTVVGAALQTPPFNLVLARPADDRAVVALADALRDEGVELPGVTGAVPEVDAFADAWNQRSATGSRVRMYQRIYALTEVRLPVAVDGEPRTATEADRDLLLSWVGAFAEESFGDSAGPASNAERMVDARLRHGSGSFVLWEVGGEPVSLAGWGGQPTGARIGPVYTPPEHRNRGYGSAVTAAVSAERLAAGRRFCFLYTDLANPTSNKIHAKIGYKPVCDSIDYVFEAR